MIKKAFYCTSIMVVVLLVGAMLLGSSQVQAWEGGYISIGTGGVGGVYYPMGGGISEIINENIDIRCSVESTGASVENINLMKQGFTELSLLAANIAYNAHEGLGDFEDEPVDMIAGIGSLYPEAVQLVVLEGSGIEHFTDLAGKTVSVGSPGSGVEVMARELFDLYGMSYDDVDHDYTSFAEASSAMADGVKDAAIVWAGAPTAGIEELAARRDVRLVEIEEDKLEELQERLPYAARQDIPAGTYGIEEDVTTVAIPALLAVITDMDDDLVYEITKHLYENVERLGDIHVLGKEITLETALDGMSLPLHAGAERFYQEQGMID